MKRDKLVLSFALVFVLLGAAQAKEIRYRDEIPGTAVPSSFELFADGRRAHYVTFSGLSSLGPVHGGYLVQYDFAAGAPSIECPANTVKIPINVSASTRAMLLGGQVFMRDDEKSALFCVNPATGAFTMSLKGIFTGGMGRFTGAEGTYEYEGSGQVLVSEPPPSNMPFGGFVLKTKGKLILPK